MTPQKLLSHLQQARQQWQQRDVLTPQKKNAVLKTLEELLHLRTEALLKANQQDVNTFKKKAEVTSALVDRLTLTPARIEGMIRSLQVIRERPDPIGTILSEKTLANGLKLRQIRDALGLILFIFEARPNVITEAFALAFKSSNILIAKNGREAQKTAEFLYQLIYESLEKNNLSQDYFLGFPQLRREHSHWLMQQDRWIDLLIPRGGDQLIEYVKENSRIPVIQNDRGLCHIYVDAEADLKISLEVLVNAKTQRPGVCNAVETLLVHETVAKEFLLKAYPRLSDFGVVWNLCKTSYKWLPKDKKTKLAKKTSYDTEYLDYEINVKVVKNLQETIEHIATHGSKHSECIMTQNKNTAQIFQQKVDAAVVYWNASTRFTDGYEFGFGGEMGISTQKLHVRGPVSLEHLTCARWLVDGQGQVRK